MSVVSVERCVCGEQHVVEMSGAAYANISYLRLHDLAPIDHCEGCGRSFSEMLEEFSRLGPPEDTEVGD